MERFGEKQSVTAPETRTSDAERRERTMAEVNARLDAVRNFRLSGDRKKDIETFIEVTDRTRSYALDFRLGRKDPLETMREIRDFLERRLDPADESYRPLNEKDPEYPAKYRFYREIPEAEIAVLDAIIRYRGRASEKT